MIIIPIFPSSGKFPDFPDWWWWGIPVFAIIFPVVIAYYLCHIWPYGQCGAIDMGFAVLIGMTIAFIWPVVLFVALFATVLLAIM